MEQKVKKRTWVKDAAIVFLAIMLVLTFFSNTILNRTLPEAATALVEPNSIDSKVRISGTVSAKENYDVILDQSRKVASVAVKVGQEVATGDVLFTLEPGDSDELTAAKRELHSLELQYQKAVINADNNDYSRENRNIELAKAAVDRAQAKYDNYALTVEDLQGVWRDAVKEAMRVCGILGPLYGVPDAHEIPADGWSIDYGDGILYDPSKEDAQLFALVQAGLYQPERYLGWRFNLPAETPAEREKIRRDYMPETVGDR